jgi:ATP-dependent exoDNAse (exonuclease V) alpha subunit
MREARALERRAAAADLALEQEVASLTRGPETGDQEDLVIQSLTLMRRGAP